MTAKTETHGPDGKPLAMTHRHAFTGKRYRIVFGPVAHVEGNVTAFILADENGNLSWVNTWGFDYGLFEYIPGGQ